MTFLFAFILSLVIMLLSTPKLMKFAFKIDYIERPKLDTERKIHKESKPYLASVGIFLTF